MKIDFSERLREQQKRAEIDYNNLQSENELMKESLDQYKELALEV